MASSQGDINKTWTKICFYYCRISYHNLLKPLTILFYPLCQEYTTRGYVICGFYVRLKYRIPSWNSVVLNVYLPTATWPRAQTSTFVYWAYTCHDSCSYASQYATQLCFRHRICLDFTMSHVHCHWHIFIAKQKQKKAQKPSQGENTKSLICANSHAIVPPSSH